MEVDPSSNTQTRPDGTKARSRGPGLIFTGVFRMRMRVQAGVRS